MNRLGQQLKNRGRGAFGRGGFARGRGRGGQAQLTMLNGYNQSQRNSTNSKNFINLPKLSEKVEVGKNCKNQDNDKFCAGRQKKL